MPAIRPVQRRGWRVEDPYNSFYFNKLYQYMAERVGFEPTKGY